MNLEELNVFEGMEDDNDLPSGGSDELDDISDLDCPVMGLLGNMYLEPKPYGTTISMQGTERLLKTLGYRIVEKNGIKYALKDSEKLSRSEKKRDDQKVISVYRKLAEDLAIEKFIQDWNNVFGTTGNTGEA